MKGNKMNIYLFQFNFQSDNTVYLPYSVGALWAYASQSYLVKMHYEKPQFVFMREHPEKIVSAMDDPDIAAFSSYVWNWEISTQTAKLIKERFPECLIIFGGPHVPDQMNGFFEKYSFVDLAVHGEGEITFLEILEESINNKLFEEIPGVSFNDGTGEGSPYKKRERIHNLDVLPSPYLTGVFDDLLDEGYDYHVIWETNRGCPYSCTFCDWGSAIKTKLRLFSDDRLREEIKWFGDHRIPWIYGADANFGILPRDVSIAQWLVTKKKETGFPGKFRVNFAKNSTERVTQIAEMLNFQGLDKGITLSTQSMDEDTLKITKRKNLKIDSLQRFVREYKLKNIATNTEIILGLPGETYQSFIEGIDALLNVGIHDSLYIYKAQILPNAELNDLHIRERYQIETKKMPLVLNYSTPDNGGIAEYDEIIIRTNTMSHEDWRRAYIFSWIIQTCHAFNLTQVISVVLNELCGVKYSDFYAQFLLFAKKYPNTIIGQELIRIEDKLADLVAGNIRENVLDEFTSFNWSFEESTFLRISKSFDLFYKDVGFFLNYLQSKLQLNLDSMLLKGILDLQKSIIIRWDRDGSQELLLDYSLYSFYRKILISEPSTLQQGKYLVRINDTFQFRGDKTRFAIEVVFKGRRNIKFIYKDIKETCLDQLLPIGQGGQRSAVVDLTP